MKTSTDKLQLRKAPMWLAVLITVFVAVSPIALVVALTGHTDWHDYVVPGIVGAILCAVMAYWLLYIGRVERELEQERGLLRILIDHVPDRIFIKDAEGRRVLVNAADWQAAGAARMEDVIGKTVFELYPPHLAEKFHADDEEVLRSGRPILNREQPSIDAAGKPVWTLATEVPLRDANRNLIGLVGVIRDITAFKQATEAERVAEERYRKIFEESVEGIYQSTPEGKLLTANPALARMLGYASPEEMITCVDDLGLNIYVKQGRRDEFRQVVEAGGTVAGFESEIYRKDGGRVWISEHGRVVRDENGTALYYEGTMVDITERKLAEEKYRSFFENSIAGIFQTTLDGRYIAANPALARMLGYESPQELMVSITDLDHQLYAKPEVRTEFVRRLAKDGVVSGFEAELLRKDGSTMWILTNARLVRDSAGQPAHYEGTLVDITAPKRMEQAQLEAHRKQDVWISQLEERTREISLLNEMSDLVQCCSTLDEAYQVIEQQTQWLFPQDSGALYVINSARNLAEARAVWGAPIHDLPAFAPSECWAFRRGRMHAVESIWADDPNIAEPLLPCKHVQEPIPEAYLCVPLVAQGETLGMLHLRRPALSQSGAAEAHGVCYSEVSRQLAHTVADSLALSISNLGLRESLRQQSIRDPLTGMFNRRYMEESLDREVARAARAGRPLSVIMLDIDHFKNFNDRFGHTAGDAVLREIGSLLRAQVREADIACRYGGEEFALIMPDASLEVARQRAELIRECVGRLELQHNGKLLGAVCVSLGVAELPRHGRTGEEVIQMADAALYKAKQAGRNRVATAEG